MRWQLRQVRGHVVQVVSCSAVQSVYDPEVKFLELGVSVNGERSRKIYGPELNGVYVFGSAMVVNRLTE